MSAGITAPRPGFWRVPGALLLLSAALYAAGPALGLAPRTALGAAVGLLCMGLWASAALPEIVTTFLFFALATLTALAPPQVVFSGFAASAFWLVLSGMVVGLAIARTGLAARIAGALAAPLSRSYPQLIAGVICITYGLSFVMPSNMGRIALLIPIMQALCDRIGLAPGRPGRTGVMLAVGFGTFLLSASILPANVPNLVMTGAAEQLYGLHFGYLPYLALHAPVVGLGKGVLLIALICLLFPDRLDGTIGPAPERAGWSRAERRLALLLVLTLALWMSDSLHHISPAWIGLAGAALCLMPGIGVLPPEAFGQINMRTIFYVAGLLGLVATVNATGVGDALGHGLVALMPFAPGAPAQNFALLLALGSALSLAATANGVPALLTPMARELAAATGFSVEAVVLTQVLAFSTVILPYQAPPIIVAVELGKVRLGDATRLALASSALTFLLLAPLDYAWWRFLGVI
ncbi:SLC13 family permease [Azorhizobium doebereinerae]|uniref:SLC13 family permease n=1 Tax=Azorhizobium doebereinerae TaxID=281091 RepID=UPI00040F927F|nr:SLC13 family permease [Azorhizobium doebereinerae]